MAKKLKFKVGRIDTKFQKSEKNLTLQIQQSFYQKKSDRYKKFFEKLMVLKLNAKVFKNILKLSKNCKKIFFKIPLLEIISFLGNQRKLFKRSQKSMKKCPVF